MRLPTVIIGFSLLLFSVFSVSAATFKTPQALLNALYSYDTANSDDDAPSPYSAFFSRGLNRLLQADRDTTPDGDVGAVDFDPVIAGQDGEAKNVRLSPPIMLGDSAELEVTFRNGSEAVTLYYTLVRDQGGWKVDDIANQQGEHPWSLRELLTK